MARVHQDFLSQYAPLPKETLTDPIVFVVDMIEGFIHEGALHDKEIHKITANIKELLTNRNERAIFVADAHPPLTREFHSYPKHCVIGSNECEVVTELKPYIDELIRKNSTNTFTSVDFQIFLKERIHQYKDIIIVGCCTDICILQFALCLNAWLNEHNEVDKRVIIPLDCVDTYHIENAHDAVYTNEFSIKNMEASGIMIVSNIERGK